MINFTSMKYHPFLLSAVIVIAASCSNNPATNNPANADSSFAAFENDFIDAYWKQNPSAAIYAGYGKYYDELKIPDSAAFAGDVKFAKKYLDSLKTFSFNSLSPNNKIDYRIVENQFNATVWYTDTFKFEEWDPSTYNIGGECNE